MICYLNWQKIPRTSTTKRSQRLVIRWKPFWFSTLPAKTRLQYILFICKLLRCRVRLPLSLAGLTVPVGSPLCSIQRHLCAPAITPSLLLPSSGSSLMACQQKIKGESWHTKSMPAHYLQVLLHFTLLEINDMGKSGNLEKFREEKLILL